MKDKSLKIAVVCGGISTEREVSLRSGAFVYKTLTEIGYTNTILFDLKSDNLQELINLKPDIAYLTLHGKGGEDGCIQGALELAGIPYTGPGVEASAVCMNKTTAKKILNYHNIATPKFISFNKTECECTDNVVKRILDDIGTPVVLKSPCQGSSIGVIIVKEEKNLTQAVEDITALDDGLLAEAYVTGTEITLPVYEGKNIEILPVIEIVSENEFYDYDSKYTSGRSRHIIPARISSNAEEKVRRIGEAVFYALGCRGISRIDFIINQEDEPMVIEINTLPGMTETSLFPDAVRSAGKDIGEVLEEIIENALNR